MRSISTLQFEKSPRFHFDSASTGIWPRRSKAGLPVRRGEKSDNFNWDRAVKIVQERFGKLVGQPAKTISIFHNTTAGVQRVLLRLGQLFGTSEPTLLLSDLEYPGIVSAVDEAWAGRVVMARVADLIWAGHPEAVTETLIKSILLSRPRVVYLSHVARATGYRLDAEKIVRFIRSEMPRTVIVLDGAQACGNICISSDFLKNVDIYVTSGHKWLCGEQTLGLVYASEDWQLKDPAQSYSMTSVSTGTGSRAVIESLQQSLSDFNGERKHRSAHDRMEDIESHNATLANTFAREIRSKRMGKIVAHQIQKNGRLLNNGIVTVVFDYPEILAELRRVEPNPKFTPLESESWRDDIGAKIIAGRYFVDPDRDLPFELADFQHAYVSKSEGYPARFCFHYYHSLDDVSRLLNWLRDASDRLRQANHKPKRNSSKGTSPNQRKHKLR